MADRDKPVLIVAVDDEQDGLRAERESFSHAVEWVTVSPELLAHVMQVLENRENFVRLERPRRKATGDGEE